MTIDQKLADAINDQINAEFWSAFLYLSMACYWEQQGRSGVANWFKVQFKEEQDRKSTRLSRLMQKSSSTICTHVEEK
mgnify:CR=1 FL=1